MSDNKTNKATEEIDLIELFLKIWAERKFILKVAAVFLFIGLIIAFGTPKEYKAETTLIIESNKSVSSGLLQQFGGLAGINIPMNTENAGFAPDLYPSIIESKPFLVDVLKEKISSGKNNTSISVYEYLNTQVKTSAIGYIKNYTIGLPGKIISLFQEKKPANYAVPVLDSIINITKEQEGTIQALKGRIKLNTGDVDGKISIGVEMPEALASAELTNIVYHKLTRFITDHKIQKAKKDLAFIENQTLQAKLRYQQSQEKLARFRDSNHNIIMATFRTEEEKLVNEMTLTFNVYNGLSQQLEQSKIKVQEDTPVFKVLNQAQVPLNKSKPRRSMILIFSIFIGGFLGVGIVFGKILLVNMRATR